MLPGLFALLIFLSVGLVASLSLVMQFREADQSARVLMGLIGGRVEDFVDHEFQDLRTLLRIYLRETELHPSSLRGDFQRDTFVRGMLGSVRTQPLMNKPVSLGFIRPDGQGAIFDRRPTATSVVKFFDLARRSTVSWYAFDHFDRNAVPLSVTEVPSDPREDSYYQDAVKKRDEVISDVHPGHWAPGARVISAYLPSFHEDGRLRMVLTADLDLRSISIRLREIILPAGATIVVFDGQGRLVSASIRQSDDERGPLDPEGIALLASNQDPAVRAVHQGLSKPGRLLAQENFMKVRTDQDLYYVYSAPVSASDVQDWYYAIGIPRSVLIEPVMEEIRLAALVAGLLILVAILFGAWIARWVTRPVTLLGKAALAVEEHQFDEPQMPCTALMREAEKPNEFGRLAALFVRMIDEVRERHRLLETQLEQLRVSVSPDETNQQVKEFSDTEFFKGLRQLSQDLRASGTRNPAERSFDPPPSRE